jgi:F-type H+-transporting ATPase subunit b
VISLDLAFVIQLINVLLILFILNTFLFKPIRKALADRAAEINGARQKTESVDISVQEKVAAYEARMRDVRAQAAAERATMKKAAEAEEQTILEKARQEATVTIGAIREKVAQETADARELLRKQALVLSSDICEKVLGRSL